MNSFDEEEKKIEQWLKNPIIPQWLNDHIKAPATPNTLHYDGKLDKYVYTPTEGEILYFNSTEEAYEDSRVDDNNTELNGEFPDLLKDRAIGQTTKNNRILFFKTNDRDYKNLLYKIYLCQDSEERYEADSNNFFTAARYISQHMLNWRIDERPISDYWFEDYSHISKIALITGQVHVWKVGTTVNEKSTMTEHEHTATGNTIEQAIVNLAADIYNTYTWEGNTRK